MPRTSSRAVNIAALRTPAAACRIMGLSRGWGKSKMRWSQLSLVMGVALSLLVACANPQSAPNPATSAAAETKGKPDVERRYAFRIDYSDPKYNGGKPDTGTLLLNQREGAEDYAVNWDFDGYGVWDGLAVPSGGSLVMALPWFSAKYPRYLDTLGLAIYRIEDGKLIGMAVEERRSERQRIPETLVGPPSLNGRFEIEAAGAPARSGYVKITPKKGGYLVARIGDHPVMTGVGIRVGDMLIVSYGSKMSTSVAYFCRTDGGLKGLLLDLLLRVHNVVLTNPEQPMPNEADHECLKLLEAAKL